MSKSPQAFSWPQLGGQQTRMLFGSIRPQPCCTLENELKHLSLGCVRKGFGRRSSSARLLRWGWLHQLVLPSPRISRLKPAFIPFSQPEQLRLEARQDPGSPQGCHRGLDPMGRGESAFAACSTWSFPSPGKILARGSAVHKGGGSRAVKADRNSATSATCRQRSSLQPNRSQGCHQSHRLEASL